MNRQAMSKRNSAVCLVLLIQKMMRDAVAGEKTGSLLVLKIVSKQQFRL
jgi:hypothetical protein